MKIVIFGLSMSSSWGNGHATLWRGLCRALMRRGHEMVFFERNTPYYAATRDLPSMPEMSLIIYPDWQSLRALARTEVTTADVTVITSYCPDGPAAAELAREIGSKRVFYDLDSPVTIDRLERGEMIDYLPSAGLSDFHLVLSYAGGRTLDMLQHKLGARRTAALYGSVDPEVHRPQVPDSESRAALSYLGTYSLDRQEALEKLFLQPASRLPGERFLLAGSQYPEHFPWTPNLEYLHHLPPAEHARFFQSARLTLNITRAPMVRSGFCPSGRLFEASACGIPVLSDDWEGLSEFYEPGSEILVAHSTHDVVDFLTLDDRQIHKIAKRSLERTLACHTADHRARELEVLLEELT